MDEHCLDCITHRGARAFCVDGDLDRHIKIRALVNVEVAIACARLDYGDA